MLHSKRKCSEWTQGLFKNKNIRCREESLKLRAWFSWSRDEKNGDNTGSSQWLKAPLGDCRFVTVSWRNVTSARDGGGRLWEWKMIREKLLHSFRLFPPEGTFSRWDLVFSILRCFGKQWIEAAHFFTKGTIRMDICYLEICKSTYRDKI